MAQFTFEEFKEVLLSRTALSRIGDDFAWVSYGGIQATEECHYEINADKSNRKTNHDGAHIFVEVHFETSKWNEFVTNIQSKEINGLKEFPWLKKRKAFRLDDIGFDMNNGSIEDAFQYVFNQLEQLNVKVGDVIKQTLKGINMANNKIMDEYVKLLAHKKNIILQGAPGVGKTYTTAALALAICGVNVPDNHDDVMKRYEELRKEGRIGFVTFHQSMDYEDFVEGIKPLKVNGQIIYDIEKGIFKSICEKVKLLCYDINEAIIKLKKEVSDKKSIEINSIRSDAKFHIKLSDNNMLKAITNKDTERPVYDTQITKYIKTGSYDPEHQTYEPAIGQYIKEKYLPPHVLIIDEINRGNVSKIFGELITLLEADKRIDGDHPIKVTLPYSKEEFGVPSNLYIIGTMNTTDRSVGNIDYAVRRRFAFVTLKSKKDVVAAQIPKNQQAENLFDAVEAFIKKNQIEMDFEDLMVGHSYFIAKDEAELEMKWKYEIIPLLHEYYKDGLLQKDVLSETTVDDFISKWKKQSS